MIGPCTTPRSAADRLIAAIYDRDVESAASLYEEDATLVCYPGMVVKGKPDIRNFLKNLFSLNVDVHYEPRVFTETAGLAMFAAKWKILKAVRTPLPMPSASFLVHITVLRQQPDGAWLIAVDNPWGPEPPPGGGT